MCLPTAVGYCEDEMHVDCYNNSFLCDIELFRDVCRTTCDPECSKSRLNAACGMTQYENRAKTMAILHSKQEESFYDQLHVQCDSGMFNYS